MRVGRPKLSGYREWNGPTADHRSALGPCIEGEGPRDDHGYVRVRGASKDGRVRGHRAAWEEAYGPIPPGLDVCHKCDNPPCRRLDHLFLGTQKENHQDKVRKGRQAKGNQNPRTKLTEEQAVYAMARMLTGETGISVGRSFGVSKSALEHLWRGNTWRWLFVEQKPSPIDQEEKFHES